MTDNKLLANALAQTANKPRLDVVGPTADDDIRRAISRYGAKAVMEAFRRQTKPKRGRKPDPNDIPELRAVFEADAKDWLAGGDPFGTRTNYSIAKDFADKNPGHSHPGTMKRITRKLNAKRVWITLALAMELSREGYPHTAHLRTLRAMAEHDGRWNFLLERPQSSVADYEAKFGSAPPAELSIKEIENAVRNALLPPPPPTTLNGLFALGYKARD